MRYKVRDVFDDVTKYGTKIKTSQYLEHGKYPIFDQGKDYIAGYTNEDEGIFQKVPVILFGDHTGILKYITRPCFLGADGVKLLKPKDSNIVVKYLFYALNNVNIPDAGYSRHFKWLKEGEIPIPPKEQQSMIVEILDELSYIVQKEKEMLIKFDELVKSRFLEMFGDPRENPFKWPVVNFSDIAESKIGLTYKPADVKQGGVLVLRSGNIQDSKIFLQNNVYVMVSVKDELLVKKNDILMCSRNGSTALVGKVALIPQFDERVTFGAFMTVIRSCYFSYLFEYFQHPAFREQISAGTSTINQITQKMLANIKLPLPPMELQNQFTEFREKIDKSKMAVQKSLDELETLKKSLMQTYFG